MGFFRKDSIDPRPTAADFPRRLWERADIPVEYLFYLEPYLNRGLEFEKILFVPHPVYQKNQKEYILARFKEELIYLEKQEDGRIMNLILDRNRIDCVRSFEDLLRGSHMIYWMEMGRNYSVEILFNRSRKDLFEPVLNWLLDCVENFDEKEAARQGDRPERLHRLHPSLYYYSENLFRLGNISGKWDCLKIEKPPRMFEKREEPSLCLRCEMERGQGVVWLRETKVDIWYLKNGRSLAEITGGERGPVLHIWSGGELAAVIPG